MSKRYSRRLKGVLRVRITREDIQRYRGILDTLVAELEEDGGL